MADDQIEHINRARELVAIEHNIEEAVDVEDFVNLEDIYVVWFCFILGGWKALCSTQKGDGLYYEVTYNKDKDETYVDTYEKMNNTVY